MRFSLFLGATVASLCGDWLTTVAVGVVLLEATGSAAAPAAFILIRTVPRLAGPVLGGLVADRLAADRALAGVLTGQAAIAAVLLVAVDRRSVVGILLVVAVSQLVGSAARPIQQAMLPRLVQRAGMSRMAGLYSAGVGGAMFLSPALGVVLLRHGGADVLVLVDLGSFVLAALLVLCIGFGERVSGRAGLDVQMALGGVRPVLRDPVLRSAAAVQFTNALAIGAVQASIVVMAADRFGGADLSGLLYAGVGGGAVLTGLLIASRFHGRANRDMLFGACVVTAVSLGSLAAVHALWLALPLLFVSAIGSTAGDAWSATEVAHRVDNHLLGRANGVIVLAGFLGVVTGAGAATLFNPLIGWAPTVISLSAVAVTVAFLVILTAGFSRRPVPAST